MFEENTTGPQATKSNAKSGSSGNTAAGVASGAAGAGLAGVAASSGNSKQSSNDKSSSKGVYDISDAQGKDIPRNEIDHSSYKTPVPDWDPRILLLVLPPHLAKFLLLRIMKTIFK